MEETQKQNIDEVIKQDNQKKEENKPEEKIIDIYRKKIKKYEESGIFLGVEFPYDGNLI
ncbi:hypothetical protein KY332_01385 [Candidatus Woesearchaeota archaeon]|nr:hypothetical protein [Candidatus Woesearchaeota archaeon]